MIEKGLLFYSKDIPADLPKAIERYKERMEEEPKTIFIDAVLSYENLAGLNIHYSIFGRNHFVLAGEICSGND